MRDKDRKFLIEVVCLLGVAVLILIGKALWAVHVYNDWTCAFSNCVKVK